MYHRQNLSQLYSSPFLFVSTTVHARKSDWTATVRQLQTLQYLQCHAKGW